MLLIHGASSNLLELWGPLAEEFSPLHRVIAYDRPGMGHSTRAEARRAHAGVASAHAPRACLKQTRRRPGARRRAFAGRGGRAAACARSSAPGQRPRADRAGVQSLSAASLRGGRGFRRRRCSATSSAACSSRGSAPPMSPASVANNFWPAPVPVNYHDGRRRAAHLPPARVPRQRHRRVRLATRSSRAQQPRYGELFTPTVIITAEKDRIVTPKRHARALAVGSARGGTGDRAGYRAYAAPAADRSGASPRFGVSTR